MFSGLTEVMMIQECREGIHQLYEGNGNVSSLEKIMKCVNEFRKDYLKISFGHFVSSLVCP